MGGSLRVELCFGRRRRVRTGKYEQKLNTARLPAERGSSTSALDCELVIVHPHSGDQHPVRARAVALIPCADKSGVGLEFWPWSEVEVDALAAFAPGRNRWKDRTESQRPRRPSMAVCRSAAIKLARTANQEDRVSLERRLGKTVWEALLRNPKVTPRSRADSAKEPLPRPLLDIILVTKAGLHSGNHSAGPADQSEAIGRPGHSRPQCLPKPELRVAVKTSPTRTWSAKIAPQLAD